MNIRRITPISAMLSTACGSLIRLKPDGPTISPAHKKAVKTGSLSFKKRKAKIKAKAKAKTMALRVSTSMPF
jgi:hypothetical protein